MCALRQLTPTCAPLARAAKFASMHAFRWELVLEGSEDGASWHEYGWRYKPWSPTVAPPWIPLHLPRLDWRVWFLPLGCKRQGGAYSPPHWLHGLLRGVLRHEPAVLSLLDLTNNPFPHAPPRELRTRLVAFSFPPEPQPDRHWDAVALPQKGRWDEIPLDTTGLCLAMRREECEAT